MIIATTITALEALTADALKSADDAQLARLDELATALSALIEDERERRNPTETDAESDFGEALERAWEIGEQAHKERMAAYRARRATIKEAVEYCATNPDLYERMKAIFRAERELP
jgi:hypothetical protein